MTKQPIQRHELIECSVVTELQAAIITKICKENDIKSIIKIKPFVDIKQLKKALKTKLKDKLYDPCSCGSGEKLKFCCYENKLKIEL